MARRQVFLILLVALFSAGCVVAYEPYRTSPGYDSYSSYPAASPYGGGYGGGGYGSGNEAWPDYDSCCSYDYGFSSGFDFSSGSLVGLSFNYHMGSYNPYPWYTYHRTWPWSWTYVPSYYVVNQYNYINNHNTIINDRHHPHHQYYRHYQEARQQRQNERRTWLAERTQHNVTPEDHRHRDRPVFNSHGDNAPSKDDHQQRWNRREQSDRELSDKRHNWQDNQTKGTQVTPEVRHNPFEGRKEQRDWRSREQDKENSRHHEQPAPNVKETSGGTVEQINPRRWLNRNGGDERGNQGTQVTPEEKHNPFEGRKEQRDWRSREQDKENSRHHEQPAPNVKETSGGTVEQINPRRWLNRNGGDEHGNRVTKENFSGQPVHEQRQHEFNNRAQDQGEHRRQQEMRDRQEQSARQAEIRARQEQSARQAEMRARQEQSGREAEIRARQEQSARQAEMRARQEQSGREAEMRARQEQHRQVAEPPRQIREPVRVAPEPVREAPHKENRDKDKDKEREKNRFGH